MIRTSEEYQWLVYGRAPVTPWWELPVALLVLAATVWQVVG